jgi:hypothetical protein
MAAETESIGHSRGGRKTASTCPPGERQGRRGLAATCLGYRSRLPLFFLPLYNPLAMRVAMEHILGKSERKIWV